MSERALPLTLWIVGASVRSAVESALRARYHVHAADLFADSDLRRHLTDSDLPGKLLSCQTFHPFPGGLRGLAIPPDCEAWLYTGGLENDPQLVEELSARLPLLGVGANALAHLRNPWTLHHLLLRHRFRSPAMRATPPAIADPREWLVKPIRSAGGIGIARYIPGTSLRSDMYLQERVEGETESATFVSHHDDVHLLGRMRQYVTGDRDQPFLYRGSIGPLPADAQLDDALLRLGNVFRETSGLRGIFGVDYVLKGNEPWILEVNPRWTASCELLEMFAGESFIDEHVMACWFSKYTKPDGLASSSIRGKWTVYSTESLCPSPEFVAEALAVNRRARSITDIPIAGEVIRKGAPAFTVFSSGTDLPTVEKELRRLEAVWASRLADSSMVSVTEGS
jgi:predicted ATP-grasp superfamily ATP-dependent carboligase